DRRRRTWVAPWWSLWPARESARGDVQSNPPPAGFESQIEGEVEAEQLAMHLDSVTICHAGDVVAHRPRPRVPVVGQRRDLPFRGHDLRLGHEQLEQLGQHPARLTAGAVDPVMAIHPL